MSHHTSDAVLQFWFQELTPEQWFQGGEEVDAMIRNKFLATHTAVAANECWHWRNSVSGALAEIIVLDQFSRNIYRGTAQAFASDGQALALAQIAISHGLDQLVTEVERPFFYLPYMHSESKVVHEEALRLFTDLGSDDHLKYEKIHKDIIDRFGRYPHRNEVLGRASTVEEDAYLAETNHVFFNV